MWLTPYGWLQVISVHLLNLAREDKEKDQERSSFVFMAIFSEDNLLTVELILHVWIVWIDYSCRELSSLQSQGLLLWIHILTLRLLRTNFKEWGKWWTRKKMERFGFPSLPSHWRVLFSHCFLIYFFYRLQLVYCCCPWAWPLPRSGPLQGPRSPNVSHLYLHWQKPFHASRWRCSRNPVSLW